MNSADGATPDFPSEIVIEIFLRLPVRSLCRFKCASKPWRSLISNPDFAKKHYSRNRKQQTERLFSFSITFPFDCFSRDLESLEKTGVRLRFRDRQMPIRFSQIWNSCNGLILLSGLHTSLFLVNPSTGEFRKLPPSPFSVDSGVSEDKYGFGYDLSVDDYKVIRISFERFKLESNKNVVSVYNLRTNSWRIIESSIYGFTKYLLRDGIFCNGAFHWVGKDSVIVLDLVSESFHNMHFPISGERVATLYGLDVSGDCLCGFELSFKKPFNFWVMKEYGVRDSWVKFTVDYHDIKWIVPSRTGKLLIRMDQEIALYDPKKGEIEHLTVERVPRDAIRYEATLVPLL